jgi:hypothetical protein
MKRIIEAHLHAMGEIEDKKARKDHLADPPFRVMVAERTRFMPWGRKKNERARGSI